MQSEYTVTWVIQVTADNALDAALQAKCIQLDEESTANVFETIRHGILAMDTRETIDLDASILTAGSLDEV